MLLYLQFLIIFDAFPSLYYSIICRRLSHGRKLSLAGEQANLCRERQREERERERVGRRGFAVGFRSVRKSMPKVLAKLETWLWARQPNQQAIVAGRTRCYLKSKPLSRTVNSCDKDFSTATAGKTF